MLRSISILSLASTTMVFGVFFTPEDEAVPQMEPWSERTGFAVAGESNDVTFVRANIEDVFKYLENSATSSTADAIGKEIEMAEVMSIAFQIDGSEWTAIVESHMFWERHKNGHAPSNQELSKALTTEVIRCTTSDTVGTVGLTIHENGELASDFQGPVDPLWDDPYKNDKKYRRIESSPYPEDPGYTQVFYYLGAPDDLPTPFPDAWDYLEQKLIKRSIYQSGLSFSYFFDHEIPDTGKSTTLTNNGIVIVYPSLEVTDVPQLSRVDCFAFKKREQP